MAASAREEQPPREQPHRERRNRIAATFATADMVGNSRSPMANTGALFRDLRSAILAATNIGVSPRAGLLTKPAGAWSVATIKVQGSRAGLSVIFPTGLAVRVKSKAPSRRVSDHTANSLMAPFNSLIARFNSLFDRNKFPVSDLRELCCNALSLLLNFCLRWYCGGCIDENSLLIPC